MQRSPHSTGHRLAFGAMLVVAIAMPLAVVVTAVIQTFQGASAAMMTLFTQFGTAIAMPLLVLTAFSWLSGRIAAVALAGLAVVGSALSALFMIASHTGGHTTMMVLWALPVAMVALVGAIIALIEGVVARRRRRVPGLGAGFGVMALAYIAGPAVLQGAAMVSLDLGLAELAPVVSSQVLTSATAAAAVAFAAVDRVWARCVAGGLAVLMAVVAAVSILGFAGIGDTQAYVVAAVVRALGWGAGATLLFIAAARSGRVRNSSA